MNHTSRQSGFATAPEALPADANKRNEGASGDDPPGGAPTASDDLLGPTSAMGSGDRTADAMLQPADAWMQQCRSQVRAHPLSAVAMAMLGGLLIGRLSRSSERRA